MFSKAPLPDDPRRSLPDKRRDCPVCGHSATIADRPSESITLDRFHRRIDYWCAICEAYVGGEVEYDGPVPVETHNGTELH